MRIPEAKLDRERDGGSMRQLYDPHMFNYTWESIDHENSVARAILRALWRGSSMISARYLARVVRPPLSSVDG